MKITVLHNQSLLDIAIQVTGKPENYLLIAKENNKVPTDNLKAGEVLIIPDDVVFDTDIKMYYQANGILPATALGEQQIIDALGKRGIGNWRVEVDFVVS